MGKNIMRFISEAAISNTNRRYCQIRGKNIARTMNEDFENLLRFIGTYKVIKARNNSLSNGYLAIRQKSKVHISKHEISALRKSYWCSYGVVDGNTRKIKIPYHIEQIFATIIILVKEIEEENSIKVPPFFPRIIGEYYRNFCLYHYDWYMKLYPAINAKFAEEPEVSQLDIALRDVFTSLNSILLKKFE